MSVREKRETLAGDPCDAVVVQIAGHRIELQKASKAKVPTME
jgi:hypothetical protein